MPFTRITDADLEGKGVIGQPEVPGLPALEMQQKVEQIVREVAIPAVNRLAGELEAEAGAASIGMELPEGMPEGTPATVRGVAAAHIEDRANPHAVTAAQVGAYTKAETDAAIDNKVVEIGTGDMAQAVFAANGEPGVVDKAVEAKHADTADAAGDGVKVYAHTRTGTVHNFAGSGANGRALMTADVEEGDAFALNGEPVEAWMGAEDAAAIMAGRPYAGRWVTFVADEEEGALNFKGGNGLSVADKAKLIPANISYGVNLFEGTPREVGGDLSLELVKEGTVYIAWDGTRGATAVAEWEADRDSRVLLFIGHNGDLQYFTGPTIAASINGSATSADNFFPGSTVAKQYRAIGLHDLKKGDTIKGSIYMYTKSSKATLYVRVYRL